MKHTPIRSDSAHHAIFHLAIPLKIWVQRSSAVLLMAASLGLIMLGRFHHHQVEQLRLQLTDAFVPIISTLTKPINTIIDLGKAVNETLYVRQENIYLRHELERLQQEALSAQQTGIENTQLRQLLNFVDVHNDQHLSARIIGDASGPFLRTVMINAGSIQGVRKGQVVVNEKGFIGRIINVGKRSARILLITDINSRIPIIMERSRERGILVGQNSEYPEIIYLPRDSKTMDGELVITSGDGKMVPPGLPVGRLYRDTKGHINIKPLVEWHRLEYVSIIN